MFPEVTDVLAVGPTLDAEALVATERFADALFGDDCGFGPWDVSVDWGDNSTATTFQAAASGTLGQIQGQGTLVQRQPG